MADSLSHRRRTSLQQINVFDEADAPNDHDTTSISQLNQEQPQSRHDSADSSNSPHCEELGNFIPPSLSPSVSSVSSRPVNIVSANFTIMSTPFNAVLDILPFSLPQLPLPRMPQKRQLNWMVYQTFLEPQVPRLRRVSVS